MTLAPNNMVLLIGGSNNGKWLNVPEVIKVLRLPIMDSPACGVIEHEDYNRRYAHGVRMYVADSITDEMAIQLLVGSYKSGNQTTVNFDTIEVEAVKG